jgi:hypothetical protein
MYGIIERESNSMNDGPTRKGVGAYYCGPSSTSVAPHQAWNYRPLKGQSKKLPHVYSPLAQHILDEHRHLCSPYQSEEEKLRCLVDKMSPELFSPATVIVRVPATRTTADYPIEVPVGAGDEAAMSALLRSARSMINRPGQFPGTVTVEFFHVTTFDPSGKPRPVTGACIMAAHERGETLVVIPRMTRE